jgi:hypothetical protein
LASHKLAFFMVAIATIKYRSDTALKQERDTATLLSAPIL